MLSACQVDQPAAPRPNLSFDDLPPPDCETQIIPDPSCPPPETYEPTVLYYDSLRIVQGDAIDAGPAIPNPELFVSPAENPAILCPRSWSGIVGVTVPDEISSNFYRVTSHGTWIMDFIRSIPYLATSAAVYNWPRGPRPGGYWDATRQFDGRPAEVFISQMVGTCSIVADPSGARVRVTPEWAMGVRIKDPQNRRTSDGDGGGSGGGTAPEGCRWEFIIIEVNYGDGTGWHELWSGNALVCDS